MRGVLLFLALVGVGCSGVPQRVLLIGDACTTANSLGEVYKGVTESLLPDTDVSLRVIAGEGMSLKKHFANTSTTDAVAAGEYDVLVLQEERNLGALNTRMSRSYWRWHNEGDMADKHQRSIFAISRTWLAPAVKKHNVTVVYLQTWGFRRRSSSTVLNVFSTFKEMQRALSENYAVMDDSLRRMGGVADEHSHIAPVGEAFESVYDADVRGGVAYPEYNDGSLFSRLYSTEDGLPSELGTFVAAHTLFATVNSRRKGEWRAASASYRPSGVGKDEGEELIRHAWETAAPVSPQLRRLQGLFMKAPQWELYVLRGRTLVKAEALERETPVAIAIDDSGAVPRARINGTLVELREDGGRDRLVVGDDYYAAFYEKGTTEIPERNVWCEGTCSMHAREETCVAHRGCMWYRGKCARPCQRYQTMCCGECYYSWDLSGSFCYPLPWESGCKSSKLCGDADVTCTFEVSWSGAGSNIFGGSTVVMNADKCYPRCDGFVGEAMCTGDSLCLWDDTNGKCGLDKCAVHELQTECPSSCRWVEGAKGGNGDGLCLSPSHSYPPPKTAAKQVHTIDCYVLSTGEVERDDNLCLLKVNHSLQIQSRAWAPPPGISTSHASPVRLCLVKERFDSLAAMPNSPPADEIECNGGLGWTSEAQEEYVWTNYVTNAHGVEYEFTGQPDTPYALYADDEGTHVFGVQGPCDPNTPGAMCFKHIRLVSGEQFIDVEAGSGGLVVKVEDRCAPAAGPSGWAAIRKQTADHVVVDVLSPSSSEELVRIALSSREVNGTAHLAVYGAFRTKGNIDRFHGLLFGGGHDWYYGWIMVHQGMDMDVTHLVDLGRGARCQCHRRYEEEYGYCASRSSGGVTATLPSGQPATIGKPTFNASYEGLKQRGLYVKTTGAVYKAFVQSSTVQANSAVEFEIEELDPTP
eukprot:Sspe_Gene.30907::Locus_15271_Transcript_2_2_Confidence_0.500_Length_2812::g.30907::m.30907